MKMNKYYEDFYVRYGNADGVISKSIFDTYDNALGLYESVELNPNVTWKELVFSPATQEEYKEVLKSECNTYSTLFNID